jgi:hypothetical protein
MERRTIIVTVEMENPDEAFSFVEAAVERAMDAHAFLHAQKGKPATVHVATQDGTRAVLFD